MMAVILGGFKLDIYQEYTTNLVFVFKVDGRVMTPLNFDPSFARIVKFRCHQHQDQRRAS